MISFAAPAGTSSVATTAGYYDVTAGILQVPDDVAEAIGTDLVNLGFVNLGSSSMTLARVAAGQFAAPNPGPSDPLMAFGGLNISIWPVSADTPITGTFTIERSFDNGATWLAVTNNDIPFAMTLPNASGATSISTQWVEPENGVLYRINPSGFTGGPAKWRLSHS